MHGLNEDEGKIAENGINLARQEFRRAQLLSRLTCNSLEHVFLDKFSVLVSTGEQVC